uniref:Sporulation domain-containing protein n=1 Tax=Aureimonas frigidaquae TaxID=424757 RepID=A0A0P0Z4L6_9HYPH|nr:sporulation domain-containing protein [Aureimonas frigidaquae]
MFNLSEPASPRDAMPAETSDFVPASHHSAHNHAPAKPVLDDFDRLIANEMAVMGHGQPRNAQAPYDADAPAEQPFHDYDIHFGDAAGQTGAYRAEDDAADAMPVPVAAAARRRTPATGGLKQGVRFVSGVAGVALLSIAAAVAYNSLFGGSIGSGEALVVAADTQPYKTRPEDPGGREIPNQNKAVYQRAAGSGTAAQPTQETLISAMEEPVDITAEDEETALPGVLLGTETIPLGEEQFQERFGDADGTAGAVDAASSEAPATGGILEPRRVRTVEVGPDGTPVGAQPGSAPAPEAAALAPEADPMAALIASATAQSDGLPVPPPAGSASLPVSMPAMPAEPAQPAAAELPPAISVVPTPAPARPTAALAPAPAAAPARETPAVMSALAPTPQSAAPLGQAAAGSYFVQIAAQPTEALAHDNLRNASQRYANILDGRPLSIQAANVENRGTFYRIRARAASQSDADQLCSRLKRAGADCFVTR